MAREAGFSVGLDDPIIYAAHERFAALVAAHEREKQAEQEPVAWMNDSTPSGVFARHKKGAENFGCTIPLYAAPVSIEAAVLAEREACAKVADGELMNTNMLTSYPPKSSAAWNIAAAIRARGM